MQYDLRKGVAPCRIKKNRMQHGSPLSRRRTNFGMTFSGYWCGPNTLLPRVTITGSLKEVQYERAMASAAALVAAYGFVGSSTSPQASSERRTGSRCSSGGTASTMRASRWCSEPLDSQHGVTMI